MAAVQELDFAWLEPTVSESTRVSAERPGLFASLAPARRTTASPTAHRSPAACDGWHTAIYVGRSRPSILGALCFHGSSALAALMMACLLWVSLGIDVVRPSASVGFVAMVVPFGGSLILSTVVMTACTLRRSGA